jgi:predicted amidophosphoribosyltransferase
MRADLAHRTRDAAPQASLPLAERPSNVRDAFSCSQLPDGVEVAIVDDVMTSGASLGELARTLRRAGARSVSCWVLARTPRPG